MSMTSAAPSDLPVLDPGSPQASAIHHLAVITLGVCAGILLLVTVLVTLILVRFRARPGGKEPGERRDSRWLEIGWTSGAVLTVGVLFVLSAGVMLSIDPLGVRHDHPDLVVTGHQWWWEVHYPHSGAVTANEIHIPVRKRLLVKLESADVVHDFWVPRLARKSDMVPGHPNYIWLEADKPGTYRGWCAEFCGRQHANMRFTVVAQSPRRFSAWTKAQLARPGPPKSGPAAAGAAVFVEKTCPSCHTVAGTPAQGKVAPDLTHVASRRTLAAGALDNTPAALRRWLANPQRVKPGCLMPQVQLSHKELHELVAYLETLR